MHFQSIWEYKILFINLIWFRDGSSQNSSSDFQKSLINVSKPLRMQENCIYPTTTKFEIFLGSMPPNTLVKLVQITHVKSRTVRSGYMLILVYIHSWFVPL